MKIRAKTIIKIITSAGMHLDYTFVKGTPISEVISFIDLSNKEITTNKELEPGKYYHCFLKSTGKYSIQQCMFNGETKYIGTNTIWADDDNNQALERWKIFGPIKIPKVYLG